MFPSIVGRGCAYLDADGDGDLDLVVTENNGPARLFRNDNPTGNRFLRVLLVGDGKGTNRDAIGAEVTVEAGGVVQRRSVTAARSYLSQCEPAVTFGLGCACLAVAACLLMPTFYVNPRIGQAFVLVAFTIVVLGGMGSIPGALVGGLIIGVVGTASGAVAGMVLIWILDRFKLISVPIDVYQISHVPFRLEPADALVVIVAAVLICFIATIYPSRQAAKLDPAQALRYQ